MESDEKGTETGTSVVSSSEPTHIDRDNLGRFVKKVQGSNPGRPKGSKNRTTLIKQAMEEALTRNAAENFTAILDQAIDMAKEGDKDMIKFVLGDVLKEARRADPEEADTKKIGKIEISFSPYTGNPETSAKEVIEAEFAEVEDHIRKAN